MLHAASPAARPPLAASAPSPLPTLAAGFLAAGFLAAGFLAAGFLVAGFLAGFCLCDKEQRAECVRIGCCRCCR